MKKRIVTVLMVSLLAVSTIVGCSDKADGSETQEDIAVLQEEIESLRAQLDEKEQDSVVTVNADSSETQEEIAALQEEIESLRAQLDEKEQDSAVTDNAEDTASEDSILGTTGEDPIAGDEVDLDEIYETVKEWVDDNEHKLDGAYYWKCVLIDDDNIPEIVLFTKYSGLYAIITVDNRNKVTFIDSIKLESGTVLPGGTSSYDGEYYTCLDRISDGSNKVDLIDADVSQVFNYNPKGNSFACTYVDQPDRVIQETLNVYLKLSDNMVEVVGTSGTYKMSDHETQYYAGKFGRGEATKDIYEEYIAGFSYTDSFAVKSDCYISLESAFNAYKEEVQ